MNLTEYIALSLIAVAAGLDIWLALSGRETISQMMTRLGHSRWWVPLAYALAVIYLFFHFWPWLGGF